MESEPARRTGLALKAMGSRETDWVSSTPLSARIVPQRAFHIRTPVIA